MKKVTITFLLLVLIFNSAFSQNITNSLKGFYTTSNKNTFYTSLYLDGRGHAFINESFPGEYFLKDDILYIFPDKSVFVLKIDNEKLRGLSHWVDKVNYKLSQEPKYADIKFAENIVDPNLLYQYYKINYKEGTDEAVLPDSLDDYVNQIKSLCDKGLSVACANYFGLLTLDSYFKSSEFEGDISIKPKLEMKQIAERIISLNDLKGYSLLGSYYIMSGNKEKAKEILEKGAALGDLNSSLVLLQLGLEEETENENFDEE